MVPPTTRQSAARSPSPPEEPAFSESASPEPQVPATNEPVYHKAVASSDKDAHVPAESDMYLDALYEHYETFAQKCDRFTEDAQLSRNQTQELIELTREQCAQNRELIELLRAQVSRPAEQKEPSFKVFDRCVPELEDDPMAVERWVEAAEDATASMPDKLAVSALQDKLVGTQVHKLALLTYVKPQALFKELISVLAPDEAQVVLSSQLTTLTCYLAFSPHDGIDQARIDMTFLERGGAEHKKTCGEIVRALTAIFPDDIGRGARRLNNIEQVCTYLRDELTSA
ncbi:hypothetical protein IW147_004870 [Coemansia sp. RSA 720]|nr:hypothetical protein IW147_004870 [Coemansia sp. RSA 720]